MIVSNLFFDYVYPSLKSCAYVFLVRHGGKAENYDLVMSATRHYWNTVYQLISVPIERKLLKEPIKTILDCVTSVAKNVFDNKVGKFCLISQSRVQVRKLVVQHTHSWIWYENMEIAHFKGRKVSQGLKTRNIEHKNSRERIFILEILLFF